MFQPKEIIYGFAKGINPPHNKYMVTLYRDENLQIIASFTTSKDRAGVAIDKIRHGINYNDANQVSSYVFEKDFVIGKDPATEKDFAFPKRTTIVFDYGIREGSLESFEREFENAQVVCVMNDSEYVDLIYAMYKSPSTNGRHKAILDKILQENMK